ncbi:MAG TPA: hypothetical protein PK156_02985 [Polyangium sp.]|nr:hypothetical protein [Polyangium sp.]
MSTSAEAPAVSTLADGAAAWATKLKAIAANELIESQKLAQKLEIEAKLTLLADAEYLRAERDATAKDVETLTREVADLEAQYRAAQADPLNHYCAIKIAGSTNQFLHLEASGYVVIWETPHEFEFVNWGGGRIGVKARGDNRWIYRDDQSRLAHGANSTVWMMTPGSGNMFFKDWNDGRYWHREGGTGKMILYSTGQAWQFVLGDPCNVAIAAAKDLWEAKKRQLAERQARLNELNTLLDPNTPQRPVLEQRLATLSSELGSLQTTLATANGIYIDGVKTLQQGALSMPKVGTDRRGLETNAALLGFVMPASRISMLETCEGNVLVSYQDADNRMRLMHYDATADSRNTAFEQWITDAGRVCISQTKIGTAVSLAKAVPMESLWTAEAWVLTPLPTWEWVTVAGTQDQKNALIVILGGTQLGMRSEGVFFASGFRMDSLTQGWHHVAAVKRLDAASKPVVVFYIDGAAVGSSGSPAFSAVSLNGTSHSVDLQAVSIPVGTEITVSFWARAGARINPAAAAVVLEATDAQAKRILRISIPNSAGRIVWDCGVDATNFDSLDCSAQPSDYEGTWTHWVFTKNATTGLMRIYRNGRLWSRGIGRTKPITAATKVTIGKATTGDPLGFRGDIADVCVWNKELPANEVLNGLGRPINVDDLRLAGYWKFEGTGDKAKARDYSKAGKDGTLVATPVMLDVPTPSVINIDRLAIATTTTPPPPPPAPIRGGSPVLFLDCSDDKVELPPAALPAGNAITIAFWTRAGANMPRQNSILEAINPNVNATTRALGVHLPWSPEVVYFDCGLDASGCDRIEKPITTAEYRGIWVHWAFSKNCTTGEMKIYRNGVLWQSGTGKTKPIPAATKFMVGCSINVTSQLYHGELTELSIWNRALSDAEVTNLMGTTLRGDEPGLHGYWNFDASQATDLTAGKRHGTYFGSPVTTPPVPQQASAFFDGTDDHVVVPEMNVDFSQGLSIETWVFYDRYNNVSRILDFGAGTAADNFLLWNVSTSSTLRFSVFRGNVERSLDASSILETGKWIHLAATVDSAGNAKIYKNGVQVASGLLHAPANVSRTKNYFGRSNWAGDGYFSGRMAEVRIWSRVRTQAEIQSLMTLRLSGQEAGLVGYWTFTTANAPDLTASARHGVYTSGTRIDVVSAPNLRLAPPLPSTPFTALPPFSLPLKLSEVRLWNTALNDDEIAVNSKTLLSGNEPNLIAYLPMNEAIGSETRDITGAGFGGTLEATVAIRWACGAPIGNLGSKRDGISAIEYSTVIFDPAAGRKTSIMRRFYGGAANDNLLILPDKRIEELDQVWIGNAQFNPTLLGYIEGAPPVPSENLTEDFSYNGATSVELVVSEELEFRWNQSEDIGAGISLDTFRGLDMDVEANEIAVLTTAAKLRAGVKANLNLGWNWQRETSVATQSTNRLSDRLELRGTPEQTPKFPHLGKRFIPKNVGYALVVSATADVFATRLRRSGKMIGYEVVPVDGIPPDVNTITFLMNPAYVMAGSLDGLTGTHPTSDKFHRHVPAMRAQYGAMYPASYYRVKEAYALKQAIENEDKRREAFFAQFSTEDAGFAMNSQIDQGQTTQPIGTNQSGTAAAGTAQNQSISEQTEEVNKRQSMIQSTIGDPSKRAHADASFKAWQRKMERLQVLAGKRNIVNTYVWDADGGLRTETQSFANMAEHTIGGSFSVDGGLGAELQGNLGGPAAELTVLVNGSLTQTASKAQSTTTGVELNVDLSGVEATGITNHDDMPILPGEKVDRYRFMTFYLENSTQNFHDFWGYVVDPEWLRSNGEEARALRRAMGKANKTWRVLHRVTYVERPSLMGFGQDVRSNDDASGDLIKDYLVTLTETQVSLQSQLDEIKTILAAMQTKLNP